MNKEQTLDMFAAIGDAYFTVRKANVAIANRRHSDLDLVEEMLLHRGYMTLKKIQKLKGPLPMGMVEHRTATHFLEVIVEEFKKNEK